MTEERFREIGDEAAGFLDSEVAIALYAECRRARAEKERVARERDGARRALPAMDCRYTGGPVADVGGRHCPLGQPCVRCQRDTAESALSSAREEIERLKAAAAHDLNGRRIAEADANRAEDERDAARAEAERLREGLIYAKRMLLQDAPLTALDEIDRVLAEKAGRSE